MVPFALGRAHSFFSIFGEKIASLKSAPSMLSAWSMVELVK